MNESSFSWMPIYLELAGKLLDWRQKQPELIAILRTAQDQGYSVGNLNDRDINGQEFPLKIIDPFTFFATFNRKVRAEYRFGILKVIKTKMGLLSPLPSDLTGLPIMNPQKSWFFSFEPTREKDSIDTLWDFAEAIVKKPPEELPPDLFVRCLKIRQVGIANLTMGMFWMRPDSYFALDSKNCAYLERNGIEVNVTDWASYRALQKHVEVKMPGITWPALSLKAYEPPDVRYWLFQANPDLYDLAGALRDGVLRTWQVKQHKKIIQINDRVVIWQSEPDSGAYALATVISEVRQLTEDTEEAAYWKKGNTSGEPITGVELKIDRAFYNAPIGKEVVVKHKDLKDLPIGKQGTNFKITAQQFHAIENLLPAMDKDRHYWLYAPGRKAKYWEECQEKSIMLIGFDELQDLRDFKSQADIEQAIKKAKDLKIKPSNDAKGAWEFTNVLKPGDILIAKKGRKTYIGYGIVDGPYERDESRDTYKNLRKVKWVKSGNWSAGDSKIVLKTLTDITKYPDYVQKLREQIGIDLPPDNDKDNFPPPPLPAHNIILYGPPGTGKTYTLRTDYMKRFMDQKASMTPEERAAKLVHDLAWWEVVALALLDAKDRRGTVTQILSHPLIEARRLKSANHNPRAMLWSTLQTHTKADCPNVKYTNRIEPLIFWKDDASTWSIDVNLVETEVPELKKMLEDYKHPIHEIDNPFHRFRFTTFHQSFSYEDFIEGIKPQMENCEDGQMAYEIRDGVFKEIVREAILNPSKDYALFIDEINRGNVASIFGELITLIEDDKRLGADNELKTVLPYSREEFGVPQNLYIVGTMNTADRSIEALDTALRRRFTFVEMQPDCSLVPAPDGLKVDLKQLFNVINARIEQLLDHDHCIGHAYFMEIKNLSDLRIIFANKVIPLLREYFYGNPGKVGMVLGERFVIRKAEKTPFGVGTWSVDELDDKEVYSFADVADLKEEDFVSIYASI
ncbi:MAG: AAA family ATPase [Pseudomonadota bacterium]